MQNPAAAVMSLVVVDRERQRRRREQRHNFFLGKDIDPSVSSHIRSHHESLLDSTRQVAAHLTPPVALQRSEMTTSRPNDNDPSVGKLLTGTELKTLQKATPAEVILISAI